MKLFGALIVGALVASAANAASFTSAAGSPDPGPAPGEQLRVTFDGPNDAGYAWTGGSISTAIGSTSAAATPATDATVYGYVSSALSPNFATLSTPGVRSISFYWGSIDTYNALDVLGPGNSILLTINGGMLPPANGDQGAAGTNRRVFIKAGPGESITGLTFRSTGVAFEFDTIAAAVPEPQSWAMMIIGFGFIGFTSRQRRRNIVAA